MRLYFRFIWLILFVSAIYQSVFATNPEYFGLKQGDRIKVEIDSTITKHFLLLIPHNRTIKTNIVGSLGANATDSITVITDYRNPIALHIAKYEIKRLYMGVGMKRATLRGALIGMAAAGPFALIPLLGDRQIPPPDTSGLPVIRDECDSWIAATLIIGVGAIVGGVIGWFSHIDKWQEIKNPDSLSNLEFYYANGKLGAKAIIHF